MNINPIRTIEMFKAEPEWVDFEPESLWADIEDKAKTMPNMSTVLTRANKDMIMAIKLCFGSDAPWEQWDVFENVVKAINGDIVLTEVVQQLFTEEVSFAVHCMEKIRKDVFSEEVRSYIGIAAKEDGLIAMPGNLLFAQDALNGITKVPKEDVIKVMTKRTAEKLSKDKIERDIESEDMAEVQCRKLASIDAYVNYKLGIEGRNAN